MKEYIPKNRERLRKIKRKYKMANKEKILASARKLYARDPTKQRRQHHSWQARRKGTTIKIVDALLVAQNKRCACCPNKIDYGAGLNIDHCHATGKLRGLLCRWCNLTLGHAKDDASLLRRLADYLER